MLKVFTKHTMATLSSNFENFPNNLQRLNRRTTAGIIVIGDEILKGFTRDVNSSFICQRLHNCGVHVKKIVVVSDEVNEIAEEVKYFSKRFDVVFTTGGIGPTHDDRTFAAIAQAFGDDLELNKELLSVVRCFLKRSKILNVDEAVNKFCRKAADKSLSDNETSKTINFLTAATKGEIAKDSSNRFPSFQVKNVIALPGVPSFCQHSFEYLQKYLFPVTNSFYSKTVFIKENEILLESVLSRLANKFVDKSVSIGSYPEVDNNYFKTKLIVESEKFENGTDAYNELVMSLKEHLVDYDETPWLNSYKKLLAFCATQSLEFQKQVDVAVQTIDEILDQYDLNDISLSFNGGKDCTLLLHLFRCCVDRRFGSEKKINGFHVLCDDNFSELCDFVVDVAKKYNLEIVQIKACLKNGLIQLKQLHPNVVAVLMGSRSTDPNGRFMKSKCEWTDEDWPKFYRVCPIFYWSYSDVWMALRGLCVPYCKLYDVGYTSLGARSITHRNPALRTKNDKELYLPAYHLRDENLERSARDN